MAAQTVSLSLNNTTDALFRVWGKAISDQMALGGWTKGTDSGQINWASVTAPVAINTSAGYEVWKSNDAAGSITDLYVKLEYGSGSSAATISGIWITVGWGSDGAGNLTGTAISTRTQVSCSNYNASNFPANLAAGAGWLCMLLGQPTSNGIIFSVERTKDSALADLNEVLIIVQSVNSGHRSQVVTKNSTVYTQETTFKGVLPTTANAVVGGNVGLGLVFGTKGGFTNPSMNLFGCNVGQLGSAQTTQTINNNGANHTYIVNAVGASDIGWANSSTHPYLTRFE